jgi:hypothetical protein
MRRKKRSKIEGRYVQEEMGRSRPENPKFPFFSFKIKPSNINTGN